MIAVAREVVRPWEELLRLIPPWDLLLEMVQTVAKSESIVIQSWKFWSALYQRQQPGRSPTSGVSSPSDDVDPAPSDPTSPDLPQSPPMIDSPMSPGWASAWELPGLPIPAAQIESEEGMELFFD